jgi:ribosomal protein L37AE/L43A
MYKILREFGVSAIEQGGQHVGNCPFCMDPDHFYVNVDKGVYDCKKCGASGNQYTLMTELSKLYLQDTPKSLYEELATGRPGVLAGTLKEAGVCHDGERWWIPYWNGSPFVGNMGYITPHGYRIFKMPGLPLKLYRPFDRQEFKEQVVICEGEWDVLALKGVLPEGISICGMPGASTFKDEWIPYFQGKRVTLLYDKDDAGQQGTVKAVRKLVPVAHSVEYIKWPEEFAGKDVRDAVIQYEEGTWEWVQENLSSSQEISAGTESGIALKNTLPATDPITTYEDLERIVKQNLYCTDDFLACVATCLAVCISPYVPEEPIWIFLVGPPSGGKTTLVECFGDSHMYVECQSQLHAKMLVSGYRDADGDDASFLPKLKMRTLIIKDYTTVLSMSREAQSELNGILRDVFDGSYKKQFGNKVVRHYGKIKFGMINSVTRAIHAAGASWLGERFLKIECLGDDFDEQKHIYHSLNNYENKDQRRAKLQRTVIGYLDHLISNLPNQLPEIPEEFENEVIIPCALLVSYLRTQVERRGDDSLLYRPAKEVASRLAIQLKKIAQCLMLVYKEEVPGARITRVITKIALDSCIPFHLEVVKAVDLRPGITRAELRKELNVPDKNVGRLLQDLMQLQILEYEVTTVRNKPVDSFQLKSTIRNIWRQVKNVRQVQNLQSRVHGTEQTTSRRPVRVLRTERVQASRQSSGSPDSV